MTEKRTLTCEEVLEHLFAYVDQELDAEKKGEVERHMERCRSCFSRAEFERRFRSRVIETGLSEAPERVRQRVRALLDKF
ncbi:MAG: anti-sigma factor family protein [Gammaproteobacteria bacterium]